MYPKHHDEIRHQSVTISMDDLVPEDHLVRKADFDFIYPLVEHTYSQIGRSSVEPLL